MITRLWVQLLLSAAAAAAASMSASASIVPASLSFTPGSRKSGFADRPYPSVLEVRGGGGSDDEYDDCGYDSEYDAEEEEEEEEAAIIKQMKGRKKSKLASSTVLAATTKNASRRTAASKAKVNAAMAGSGAATVTVSKKKQSRSLYKRAVPYIVRACLNPFTLLAMTKTYFVSLFDINYMKEDSSQTLRSALEEKARTQPGGAGSNKPKRKMKPGQAKTLSDLPQLSA